VLEEGATQPRTLSLFPEDRFAGVLADTSIVHVKAVAIAVAPATSVGRGVGGAAMNAERELTPAYYRKMAQEVRDAARTAQTREVQRDLLQLGEQFERMAAYIERRFPEGRDLSPPDNF
jgi:hypothetical protein